MTFDRTTVGIKCIWKYVDMLTISSKLKPRVLWPLDDFWSQTYWGHMYNCVQVLQIYHIKVCAWTHSLSDHILQILTTWFLDDHWPHTHWVTCATLPTDHCIQVPQNVSSKHIVCGEQSDQLKNRNIHTRRRNHATLSPLLAETARLVKLCK